jgi:hypothetical protein
MREKQKNDGIRHDGAGADPAGWGKPRPVRATCGFWLMKLLWGPERPGYPTFFPILHDAGSPQAV